jgi:histidyl-tRNA synthetase
MFRHERKQKGRNRQFHQIGVEFLGAPEPSADAETIAMLMRFFTACGIPATLMRLYVNSMGDDDCRPAYRALVRDYLLLHSGELCPECVHRANTNPLRAFDCKNPACIEVMAGAPRITDALCPRCAAHYARVKELLFAQSVAFEEAPRLVRGLDYYTRTVFEVQVDAGLGAQNAIGGGGRYDRLMEEFGGRPTPGLGFAVGLERIVLVLDALGVMREGLPAADVFVATVTSAGAAVSAGTTIAAGDGATVVAGAGAAATASTKGARAEVGGDAKLRDAAFSITEGLRRADIAAEMDHQARSLKSQLKLANRLDVAHCVIVGPDELAEGTIVLRDMRSHEERRVGLDELTETILRAMER